MATWVCPECGFDMSKPAGTVCPECGTSRASAVPVAWLQTRFRLPATALNLWLVLLAGVWVLAVLEGHYPLSLLAGGGAFFFVSIASLHIAGFHVFRWATALASATQFALALCFVALAIWLFEGVAGMVAFALGVFHACCGCILAQKFLGLHRSRSSE